MESHLTDVDLHSAARAVTRDESAWIRQTVARMTLEEKLGQLRVVDTPPAPFPEVFKDAVRRGEIGALMNLVDPDQVNALQRLATNESRLGIPLLVGRDVIHGFNTVFPIPLGQAASWDPSLVEDCARIAAHEAASRGINWTFAPMIDISRDPRWGRIAESFGEDVHLSEQLARAMVLGFQGSDPAAFDRIAACPKHFAGYGASEAGKDYNSTPIPENELRNVYLPPFRAALDAGALTMMASFGDIDGIPATAHEHLLTTILRDEWGFDGLLASDWDAIPQLAVHGIAESDADCAELAIRAGIDVEMTSRTYTDHVAGLLDAGRITMAQVDTMVSRVLRVKVRLGLLDDALTDPSRFRPTGHADHLALAKRAAERSLVLLQNDRGLLPLAAADLRTVAVLGPLADDPGDQLGTWVFDGDPELSVTPLKALRSALGDAVEIRHVRGPESTRSHTRDGFEEAVAAARDADVAVLFLGEEAMLSGEAHCRADLGLPGNQLAFLREVRATGTPVVLVLMAGRPLVLSEVIEQADAVLFAWHPGSMTGPAIADVLLGTVCPSGKLPVSFPRAVGQIPIYYAHRNTGRPPTPDTVIRMEDLDRDKPQHAVGNTSFHLDVDPSPLFPFGYGLSYARFEISAPEVSAHDVALGGSVSVTVSVHNRSSNVAGEEVVQLYVRDVVGSLTRPVRELKAFRRVALAPGQTRQLRFELSTEDLAYHTRRGRIETEPGRFLVGVGSDSTVPLTAEFVVHATPA